MIKIKFITGLSDLLDGKANVNEVANIELSNVDNSVVRTNLNVYSIPEVDAILDSISNARSFDTLVQLEASDNWAVMNRALVKDDGDGKWAIYMAFNDNSNDMTFAEAGFEKVGDQDSLQNALSSGAVLLALEQNGTGQNAVVGMLQSERDKLARISVTTNVNLDQVISNITQLLSDVANNTNSITQLVNSYTQLATDVSENTDNITSNATAIGNNTAEINNNTNNIGDIFKILNGLEVRIGGLWYYPVNGNNPLEVEAGQEFRGFATPDRYVTGVVLDAADFDIDDPTKAKLFIDNI